MEILFIEINDTLFGRKTPIRDLKNRLKILIIRKTKNPLLRLRNGLADELLLLLKRHL